MMAADINDALAGLPHWHGDVSPLGATGIYGLDMKLADAFRALLYLPSLGDRLNWIERELRRPMCGLVDDAYLAELRSWWLALFEIEKFPVIQLRSDARRTTCVSS